MIDIYNEMAHIQDVLEKGLGEKWRQDLTLLIKFWKSSPENFSKNEIKAKSLEKCIQYVPHFNPITQKGEVEKIVDDTWRKWKCNAKNPEDNSKLREISEIKISKEVLEWFLSLPTECSISQEKLEEVNNLRKDLTIKEHPLNCARVRMLFTLYIWMKIQETFMSFPQYFDFDDIKNKLRKDAKLSGSFKIKSERNLLKDLRFIKLTTKNSNVILLFQENFDVFKIPLTDENTISISENDLYNIGDWLNNEFKKRKYYTYTCELCGAVIKEKVNKKAKGRKKLYCPACAKKNKNQITCDTGKKNIYNCTCEDCGAKIPMISKYAPKKFCISCMLKHKSEQNKRNYKRRKEKIQ